MTPEEIMAAEIAMGINDEHLASLGFFPTETPVNIEAPLLLFDTDSTNLTENQETDDS